MWCVSELFLLTRQQAMSGRTINIRKEQESKAHLPPGSSNFRRPIFSPLFDVLVRRARQSASVLQDLRRRRPPAAQHLASPCPGTTTPPPDYRRRRLPRTSSGLWQQPSPPLQPLTSAETGSNSSCQPSSSFASSGQAKAPRAEPSGSVGERSLWVCQVCDESACRGQGSQSVLTAVG